MNKVLITGGAGYLGSVMARKLLEENFYVTVIDNLMYRQLSMLNLFAFSTFNFIHGDVRDSAFLQKQVSKHDIIIPLAAIVGMEACNQKPKDAVDINYNQIKDICNVLAKDQKIIMPNTNSQYGSSEAIITEESPFKPLSLYAKTKCDAEKLILDTAGVTLRLATVFGVSPRMRQDLLVNDFVYKSLVDKYLVLFESHYKRNYIHVEDIANTFVFVINNFEKCVSNTFNVGLSSANLSKLQLAEKIKEYIPNLVIYENDFAKDKDQRNYIVSNEKLEKLNWYPSYDLDFGIKQLLHAYPILIKKNNERFTNL
jgi:nucleoside-diphosphate-sugar epimerase